MAKKSANARKIPAVEKVLKGLDAETLPLPRPLTLQLVRERLAELRSEEDIPEFETILSGLRKEIEHVYATRIQPVINGTGVIIHTNMGRAPLAESAVAAMERIASDYNNLELDVVSGKRGVRGAYLEKGLALACEAEAATPVNNCAAALVVILRYFTAGHKPKEVIISRGELVEIGGGFRIPEILEASGCRLREIGATNKTNLQDYANAIGPDTAMILKVHRSNFFMEGFVDSPTTEEISELCKTHDLPLVEDLGSGALANIDELAPIEHEPTPQEILRKGVDIICVSGDKLMGGPQAGIIAGKKEMVAGIKKEPFFRALRCDKLILTLLQETISHYLRGGATDAVPVLNALHMKPKALLQRGEHFIEALKGTPIEVTLSESSAQLGGGTTPKSFIPSITLNLKPTDMKLGWFSKRLRLGRKPVIGFVNEDLYKIDLRTVFPRQDEELVALLKEAVA